MGTKIAFQASREKKDNLINGAEIFNYQEYL